MEILRNGEVVIIDANTDDQATVYELMCVCGHKLSEHAMPIFWHTPDPLHHTIYTRQCTYLKENDVMKFCCEQFRIE